MDEYLSTGELVAAAKTRLGIDTPDGFIDHTIYACLRWTIELHKGDKVEKI